MAGSFLLQHLRVNLRVPALWPHRTVATPCDAAASRLSSRAMAEPDSSVGQITALLREGGRGAADRLLPIVYGELRQIARARLAKLRPGQTMGATDLVHEAWMRVLGGGDVGWDGRAHFFGAAANAMRNILVEQARRHASLKRDQQRKQVLPTDLPEIHSALPHEDVLTVHEALHELERTHERPGRVVLLRFFGGLSMPEIAEVLQISVPTVERDWRFARSWLQEHIGSELPDDRELQQP